MSRYALHFLLLVLFLGTACSEKLPDFRDRKGPSVISVSPAADEAGVSVEASIIVQFNEAILFRKKISRTQYEEFDYGGFVVTAADGTAVAGFLSFNNDTVTFRGAAPLAYGTKYTVEINDRVKDLFGNRAVPFTWTFETEPDTVPPFPPYSLSYSPLTSQSPTQLVGAKEAGTTLTLNGKDTAVGVQDTNFTLLLPLSEGANVFTLLARDLAGNESTPVEITIQLDSTPPTSLTLCDGTGLWWHFDGREACWNPPTNQPILWNNFRLPLGAVWPTPEADAQAIFQLGTDVATFTANRFTYDEFDPRKYTNTVTLRAFTRDSAGNESDADFIREFKYDALATIEMREHSMFKPSGLATTWTTSAETVFEFQIESGATFLAILDGNVLASSCNANGSSLLCSVNVPDLADGSHRFTAKTTDAAGNVAQISKFLHVDSAAPQIISLPSASATTGNTPVLHVFAQEPVTGGVLVIDNLDSITPTLDELSNGRHLTYELPFIDGEFDVSAQIYDRAGNQSQAHWSFTTVGTPAIAAASYTNPVTGADGSGERDGWLTITLPAAPLHVLRWDNGGEAGFAFTTATAITIATNPLTQLHGELETFNADGASAKTNLQNDLWDTEPTLKKPFNTEISVYLSLLAHPEGQEITVFDDRGYAFGISADARTYDSQYVNCSSSGLETPTFPFAVLTYPEVLMGWPCGGVTPGVSLIDASPAGIAAGIENVLWTATGEFGRAIASAPFWESADHQIAVGSPPEGKVYLFANTASLAPSFTLKGDPLFGNDRFGQSTAFTKHHHQGRSTLAVVANGEPAVYFFENDLTTNTLTPLPKYRARVPLEDIESCVLGVGRHEVINAGDMDGDGGEDFVTASWSDTCQLSLGNLHFPVNLNFFFSNGEASSHRVASTYWRQHASARARLIPLGDLNGDGLADVGHIDRADGGLVRVYYGSADGKPVSRLLTPFTVGASENWVLAGAADIDGDGYSELILSKSTGTLTLELMAWP